MQTPPSISVSSPASVIEDSTIDPQDILGNLLVSATPQQRRLSTYDNSLRRMNVDMSDTDDSDDQGPTMEQLQRAARIGEGFEDENEQSDSSEEADLTAMVMAASKTAPSAPKDAVAGGDEAAVAKKKAAQAMKKQRPAGELAKQLKFLGKQFKGVESDEVKHVLEIEKAKRDVYTFEWEANQQKAEWKQALLLATMRPADGLKYLSAQGLLKNTPDARAKWLSHYRRMVLDNPVVIEWLCQEPNVRILECLVEQENAFASMDIDVALRRFIFKLDYLPADEPLSRLLAVFGAEWCARNPHRKEILSANAAAYLASSMLSLNNMYHSRSKLRKLRINDFIVQSQGKNSGNDFPQGMLEEIFANVVTVPLGFEDPTGAGYQGERRHGWVSHKTLESKSWKKHWAVLTDQGQLYLLPEDGSKQGAAFETIDFTKGEIKASKPSEKYHLVAVRVEERIHLLQVHSLWARDAWIRHIGKFAETPESRGVVVALKDSAFSPSPIRNALKGHTRKTSVSSSRPGLRLGGGSPVPAGSNDVGLEDEELPPGALEALHGME